MSKNKSSGKLYIDEDDITIHRQSTAIERDVRDREEAATLFVNQKMSSDEYDLLDVPKVNSYIPKTLEDCIFCGHLVTDMDSIAGAIGAAELYGGIPARASEVNSETKWCLETWGVELPAPIEELLVKYPKAGVCLVDHQQTSQLHPAIQVERIVGVIDHHALQNSTIVTDMPIYIDIRPWGSMSTIIAHTFSTLNRRPKKSTAGMLLSAILSDTLNLQGPTTTDWDRLMVAVMLKLTGTEDPQLLATQQFKAKSSELAFMTPHALCNGDQKCFNFKTETFEGSVGFAVIETTDDDVIMSRAAEILAALAADKKEKKLNVLFLAVVNIVKLRSNLLMIGPDERSLAAAAFKDGAFVANGGGENPYVMDLGGLVSRKKDYIPVVTAAIKNGWSAGPL